MWPHAANLNSVTRWVAEFVVVNSTYTAERGEKAKIVVHVHTETT
jgi:hypothetical protein